MQENDLLTEELQTYVDALDAQRDPDDSEIEAYARLKNRVEADREAIKWKHLMEMAKMLGNRDKILNECDNRDKAIEWKYGRMIAQLVAAKIKDKRQRSVKTLFGTVGYRKTPAKTTRHIRCENSILLAWAEEHCPEAVVSNTTKGVTKGELPETCEHIWDETTPETDTFYWKPAKVQEKKDGMS